MKRLHTVVVVLILSAIFATSAPAQEKVYWDVVAKIREEGFENSQVMDIVGYMTDVIGPRLTGSPNMRIGQKWAKKKFEELGLKAVIEPATTHGVSWDNTYTSLHMLKPDYQPLIGYPLAFTPGTGGKIISEAVIVEIEEEKDLEKYRGKLNNKFVMISPKEETSPHLIADASRYSEDQLEQLSLFSVPGPRKEPTVTLSRSEYLRLRRGESAARPLSRTEIDKFLKSESIAAVVSAGRGSDGTVLVMGHHNSRRDRSYKGAVNALPEVALAAEHYNRIYRILERDIPVTLEMEVRNTLDAADSICYNVIAEWPGTDLKDEVVMIGGHYDTWHTGTGATDNSSGGAVCMEAVRILKAIGVQPRRTIRIGLWTYEEGGLHGSREYVNKHFGNPRRGTKKPAHDKFSGYFNQDNGAGRYRGIYLQDNEYVKPVFKEWMKPLKDLGMTTLSPRNTGGTDHLSFVQAGLNGWQFIQDGLDYGVRTWHRNMDVYDKLVEEDMKVNSVIMAVFVYHAAMRDELLPGKDGRVAPPPPPPHE